MSRSNNQSLLASPANPVNGLFTNSAANAVERVPFLGLQPIAFRVESSGNCNYNSLQATIDKRLSHGLQIMAAYTFSKSIDTAGDTLGSPAFGVYGAPIFGQQVFNDQHNVAAQRGPSDFDRTHRLVLSYTWTLPQPVNRNLLLSGWAFSGVVTLQSGLPFSIYDSAAGTLFGPATTFTTGSLAPGATLKDAIQSGNVSGRVNQFFSSDAMPAKSPSPRITLLTGRQHSSVLKTESVVDRMPQFLFASEVTFRGLNRSVSEEKLDLLQFATCLVAETRTGAPQIMWREVLDASTLGSVLHNMPEFWRDAYAPNLAEPVYSAEDPASVDASSYRPPVDSSFRPGGYRNGADVPSLADEIRYDPMLLSYLEVISSQADHFGPTESAPNQQRQDGTVTLAPYRLQGQRLQQRSGLIDGQPIANPDSQSFRALDTPDSRGQFWTQEAVSAASYASRRTAANRTLIVEEPGCFVPRKTDTVGQPFG